MERVYLDKFDGVSVEGAAAGHLKNVLRVKPGDVFAGYDGRSEFRLRVEEARRGDVRVTVESGRELPEAPGGRILLGASLIKGPRWDWLLEKAAELGVGEIAPLAAARTVVRIDESETSEKVARWRRMLGAAAAQCAGRAPEIKAPERLEDFIRRVAREKHKYVLLLKAGAKPLAELVRDAAGGRIVLLIGPEGDWTEEESDAALAAGFEAATLGPLILRSETAAIVSAAISSNINL
ncbi:MAG: RsmE family RNA methyltransferase [bacterium]